MNAKLGSDGRLTLSGWLLKQPDSPGFAWRTKNLLSVGEGYDLISRQIYNDEKYIYIK